MEAVSKESVPWKRKGCLSLLNGMVYLSWGGGLGDYANWSWRIGASHCHQRVSKPCRRLCFVFRQRWFKAIFRYRCKRLGKH
ncbi:glycoside hydrolase family 48 protein [Bacillus sp. SL00103]